MTALESLNLYLRKLELRLRFLAVSRGAAVLGLTAFVLTVFFVYIANRSQFAHNVVLPLRILLFASVAAAIAFALVIPLLRISRRRLTALVESRIPEFKQRLTTLTERGDTANPFNELIAVDALDLARQHNAVDIFDTRQAFLLAGSGLAAVIGLLLLITVAPGYWGYGASLFWTGNAAADKRPLYDILVQPGDKTIRRRSDQTISAELTGFSAHRVTLHAKYGGSLKWETIAMQPKASGSKYQFLFAGVSDPVEYYVQADGARSRQYTINVKDLPAVRRVRVGVHYPAGLGLRDVVNDPGGDIRAVQGTEADISVLTDRPLDHGFLVTERGERIPLTPAQGNWTTARLHIQKDGSYHVAAVDSGETIRISDDYFIEAKKDEPPVVRIVNPGRDPHVSIIEEVPVTVSATDDFGVNGLDLHYSVNGGPEQVVPLLKSKGVREAEGKSTLYFENFKVVPGDLVSVYATARDAKTTSRSEMIFAQTEPFDFKFSQSQQAGGGMGGMGMGDSNNISERQKQIIAATFNEIRDPGKARAVLQEDAKFLSDLQGKLGEQAKTLAERMANRELGANGSQFAEFSRLMTQASADMGTAVSKLLPAKWQDALPPEQKALQGLLRAEALFQDIQVAFGQRSGGGGGGSGAQRDLARMFDLELDTTKNQYETGQSPDSANGGDQQKAIDDAFEKLQMLARRQQELAGQNSQKQDFEQRWEEEQLRREAEQLREQMKQLAQNGQQGSQGQQSSGSQSSQGGSSSSSSSSSSRASSRNGQNSDANRVNEALRQATSALERAENEMRKAVSDRDATAQQRAASQLRQAGDMLNRTLHDQAGSSVSDLAGRAQEIANQQKELANRIKQMYGGGAESQRGGRDWQSARNFPGQPGGQSGAQPGESGGEAMPEMNDPNSTRFGYGFRRRYWQQEMPPTHTPTEGEKALAAEKERLAAQLEQLEKQMGQHAENMSGTRPDASSKMRKALSEAEQKELALRMQKNAEWIRQGYGDRNVGMEDSVTAGVDQLSRDLRNVQTALNSPAAKGTNGPEDRTVEALNQIRQLREQLERGDANGQQQGQQGAQQSGQEGGNGEYSPRGGPGNNLARGGTAGSLAPRDVEDAIRQLDGLRGQIDPRDRALSGYIDGVLGNLHHLTGAQAGLLDARISQDTATSLERLEMELNKRLAQSGMANGARTGATEQSPESYRNAVAEYFKRLSQPK